MKIGEDWWVSGDEGSSYMGKEKKRREEKG